jgi:LPS sulfotransferase NodH
MAGEAPVDFKERALFNERSVYDAPFDRPEYNGPRTHYILCCAPRVGSWLLCDLLEGSDAMGVPAEYFNTRLGLLETARRFGLADDQSVAMTPYAEMLKRRRTTPNGVFGMKLQYWMMPPLLKRQLISECFPGARFLYMDRDDLLSQAVSYDIARHTGQWTNAAPDDTLAFDEKRIGDSIEFILRERRSWDYFFALNGIEPLRFRYEDLIADAESVCRRICDFVGVETDFRFSLDNARLKKQANERTKNWVGRLRQVGRY